MKEIGEACVQLQVDVKLLLHQPRMDHFGTYPNMVNLHTAYLYTLYTFLHKLLTRLTSLQFLHLLLTFGQVHLISTSQKLEVIRWKPWWARKEHTNPMLMIKEEQLMCIGWEGSCKEVTIVELYTLLQLGQFEFQKTISPTLQVIEETQREQGWRTLSNDWADIHHSNRRIGSCWEIANKSPTSSQYISLLTTKHTHTHTLSIRHHSSSFSSSSIFNSRVSHTANLIRESKIGRKKLWKPSYKQDNTPEEKFIPGPYCHGFA